MDWTKLKKAGKTVARLLSAPGVLETKLAAAVEANDLKRAQALLAEGAKPDGIGYRSENALNVAVERGTPEMVKLLLDAGANPNAKVSYSMTTPFLNAAERGKTEIAAAMLAAGAKINSTDHRGNTAYAIAVAAGNKPLADLLLNNGADADTRNAYGWTPLFYAARNGDAATVDTLLGKNLRIDRCDTEGRSALDVALECGRHDIHVKLQEYADSKIPEWQTTKAQELAHVSILRAQGLRLTEVFNFETKQCTVVSHDYESGKDTLTQRSFAELGAETVAVVTAKLVALAPKAAVQA